MAGSEREQIVSGSVHEPLSIAGVLRVVDFSVVLQQQPRQSTAIGPRHVLFLAGALGVGAVDRNIADCPSGVYAGRSSNITSDLSVVTAPRSSRLIQTLLPVGSLAPTATFVLSGDNATDVNASCRRIDRCGGSVPRRKHQLLGRAAVRRVHQYSARRDGQILHQVVLEHTEARQQRPGAPVTPVVRFEVRHATHRNRREPAQRDTP